MFNCGREVRLSECGLLAHHQLLGELAAAPGSHLLVFQPSAAAGHQPSWAESLRGLGCDQPHVARHQLVPGNMLGSVTIISSPWSRWCWRVSRCPTQGCTSAGPATATPTQSASSSWTVRRASVSSASINIQDKNQMQRNVSPALILATGQLSYRLLKDNKFLLVGD